MKKLELKRQTLAEPERLRRIKADVPVLVVRQLAEFFRHPTGARDVRFRREHFGAVPQRIEVERRVTRRQRRQDRKTTEPEPKTQSAWFHVIFYKKKARCFSEIGSAARSITFNKSSQIMRFERLL